MNVKKLALATVSYVLITMLLGYPWHMVLFHDVYMQLGAVTRVNPIVPLGMASMLIQGACFAYLFSRLAPTEKSSPLVSGIRFGLIAGMIVFSVMGLANAAKINIHPISVFLGYTLAFQLIQSVVTGAVLGLIYASEFEQKGKRR